jgi:DNA polymerase elongation subunit (family B)
MTIENEQEMKFRLIDCEIYDDTKYPGEIKSEISHSNLDEYLSENSDNGESTDSDSNPVSQPEKNKYILQSKCVVQLFGKDKQGQTYCCYVQGFKPFFYLKVDENWNKHILSKFIKEITQRLGTRYKQSIATIELVEKKTLYGFDNNKLYSFVKIAFHNIECYNKTKRIFLQYVQDTYSGNTPEEEEEEKRKKQVEIVYPFQYSHKGHTKETIIQIYEPNVQPILRFFHVKNISPSGWVKMDFADSISLTTYNSSRFDTCQNRFHILVDHIQPYECDDMIPLKICSFDIEALSSNGDFPLAQKNYKRLVIQLKEYFEEDKPSDMDYAKEMIAMMLLSAFGYAECDYVDFIETKKPHTCEDIENCIRQAFVLTHRISNKKKMNLMDCLFYEDARHKSKPKTQQFKRDELIECMTEILDAAFVHYPIKGDIVTFIGSTFIRYGENEPYLNHCVVLDTCDMKGHNPNTDVIESVSTEQEVLLKWKNIILQEDPDVIIGYNIFGFDYSFLVTRANELNSETPSFDLCKEFLTMSRIKKHVCGTLDKVEDIYKVQESSITIASGTHNLSYIQMPGRLQIDLYNYFRRDYNLESYKLDFVSGYFIRNSIKKIDNDWIHASTTGLKIGFFIHIEEVGHSSDYYNNGAKFKVLEIDTETQRFRIDKCVTPDMSKKLLWCLAKDDVSPQDIFRMTREGPSERGVIAKYCIQDCNLVHYLLQKIDVITGFIEMASLCSVPISYLVMRGQGIKLFSFIAKKCMEVNTVIPFIEKQNDGGYEGAIVLPPKCGLYLDEPVAVVDYSSLYPSSMISENISHDSKVWTKRYDLTGKQISETDYGKVDGVYIYDNLPGIEYVDIEYDHYEYMTTPQYNSFLEKVNNTGIEIIEEKDYNEFVSTPGGTSSSLSSVNSNLTSISTSTTLKKVKVGKKLSRWAQFPKGKAIMPSILEELLKARKNTRTKAKYKTIHTSIGDYSGLVVNKSDATTTLKTASGDLKIFENRSILSIEDTYDSFMKNVLDKRQLAIKVTANSLYGQCGAKTSSFYEQDVAASTTSTGRKLLTYAKRVVEEVYGNRTCTTKYGTVQSNAEYIYGDSVTGDTPVYLKIIDLDKNGELVAYTKFVEIDKIASIDDWMEYENFKVSDTVTSNRREKQQVQFNHKSVYVWTKNGWRKLKRVIRHKCAKKIYRVKTNKGILDVTEDHSLIDHYGNYVKPNEMVPGNMLYYHSWNKSLNTLSTSDNKDYIPSEAYYNASSSNENMNNSLSSDRGSFVASSGSVSLSESIMRSLQPSSYLTYPHSSTTEYDCLPNPKNQYPRRSRYKKNKNSNILSSTLYNIHHFSAYFNIPYTSLPKMKSYLFGLFLYIDTEYNPLDYVYQNKHLAVDIMCVFRSIYGDAFKLKHSTNAIKIHCIDPSIAVELCNNYQTMFKGSCKNIPDFVINGQYDIKVAFVMGYLKLTSLPFYDAVFYVPTKILLCQLYHIFDCLDCHIIPDFNMEKSVYQFAFAKNDVDECIIRNIELLHPVDAVSDVEDNTIYSDTDNDTQQSIEPLKSVILQTEYGVDMSMENTTYRTPSYQEFVYDIETEDGTFNCGFPIIIKNTDSVFMSFKLTDENGRKITGKTALKHTIELAKEVGVLASSCLKHPHDLEYEKTFMPFCLLSKKRYVGMLYEDDPEVCKRKSMGIVLKRRDNAPIVKDVYGGIIDILMKEQNVLKAIDFTKTCLQNLVEQKYPIDKLIITKSLRSYYKNPLLIAHKVLADRMGKRDPGNKPASGDRIPFVYINVKKQGKTILQGDKIEHPEYIKKHNTKIDYGFYITNQIMKPVLQLFAIVLEDMREFKRDEKMYHHKVNLLDASPIYSKDVEKRNKKVQSIREEYIKRYIFDKYILDVERMRNSQKSMMEFLRT